jgi:hypothetical protein
VCVREREWLYKIIYTEYSKFRSRKSKIKKDKEHLAYSKMIDSAWMSIVSIVLPLL